jgi:hypothetical protein
MYDRSFMAHVDDAQTTAPGAQKNFIEMIANQREDLTSAMTLDRVHEQFRTCRHAFAYRSGRSRPPHRDCYKEGSLTFPSEDICYRNGPEVLTE